MRFSTAVSFSLPLLVCCAFLSRSVLASAGAGHYLCVDELGHTYRMAAPIAAQVARFTCTALPSVAVPNAPSRARAVELPRFDRVLIDRELTKSLEFGPRPRTPALAARARFGRVGAIDELILSTADEFEHDPLLLKAIIHVESAFDARAVSPKGALGLMQIMPATGKRFGVTDPQRDLFGPETNIRVGAWYLRELRNMFRGRLELAVAAYNAGEQSVVRYGYRIPPYPETQQYVRRVLSTYNAYRRAAAE
jgi:soluble lytic murein transglycosylase-like protein